MANEYRIYNLGVEVFGSGESDANIYSLGTEVFYYSLEPLRLYGSYVEVFRTIANRSNPDPLDWEALPAIGYTDVTLPGALDGFVDSLAKPTVNTWVAVEPTISVEWNPYSQEVPVTLAEEDEGSYNFQREQAENLREQHNLTQAGDTTFPWEKMFRTSDSQEYNLGAISRFFHPVYGVFLARYVKFSERWLATRHGPCGHDTKFTDWIVTNDPAKSHWSRLVGVSLPYDTDIGGKFGWALIQGRGLFEFFVEHPVAPTTFKKFTWGNAGFGALRSGVNLGIILDDAWVREVLNDGASLSPRRWRLSPGDWAVDVAGVTEEYITGKVEEQVSDLLDRITALENAPDPEQIDYSTQINSLTTSLGLLQTQLVNETSVRYNADRALGARIDSITAGDGTEVTTTAFYDLRSRVTHIEDVELPQIAVNTAAIAGLRTDVNNLLSWQGLVDAQLTSLVGAIGSITSGTSLVELIEDTVGSLLVAGTNVTLTYNDAATPATLTIDAAGGGGGGGSTPWWFDPPLASELSTLVSPDTNYLSLTDDSDLGLLIDPGVVNTNDDLRCAMKAIPSPSADWEVEIAVQAMLQGTNYTGVGLVIRDSVGGRCHTWRIASANTGFLTFTCTRWTSVNTFSAETLSRNYVGTFEAAFLRIKQVSGVYQFERSHNGKQWHLHTTQANNAFLANPADQVGLVATINNPNADSKEYFNCGRWIQSW